MTPDVIEKKWQRHDDLAIAVNVILVLLYILFLITKILTTVNYIECQILCKGCLGHDLVKDTDLMKIAKITKSLSFTKICFFNQIWLCFIHKWQSKLRFLTQNALEFWIFLCLILSIYLKILCQIVYLLDFLKEFIVIIHEYQSIESSW